MNLITLADATDVPIPADVSERYFIMLGVAAVLILGFVCLFIRSKPTRFFFGLGLFFLAAYQLMPRNGKRDDADSKASEGNTEAQLQSQPPAEIPTPPASAAPIRATPPMEETREQLSARLANNPRFVIQGKLLRHLDKDTVLVSGTICPMGYPYPHEIICAVVPFEAAIGYSDNIAYQGPAWKLGTCQYTSEDGAVHRVDKYVECPRGGAVDVKPPDWKWQPGGALDQKGHR